MASRLPMERMGPLPPVVVLIRSPELESIAAMITAMLPAVWLKN